MSYDSDWIDAGETEGCSCSFPFGCMYLAGIGIAVLIGLSGLVTLGIYLFNQWF